VPSRSDELSPVERLHFALRRVLSNEQDIEVVEKLLTRHPDSQKIYALAPGSPELLAADMALVYIKAARTRQGDVATKNQIILAKRALSALARAFDCLSKIVPRGSLSLQAALGLVDKDFKGVDEPNELAAVCNEILGIGLAEATYKLQAALDRERAKPRRSGERKKRLRSLVEALVDWWSEHRGGVPTIIQKSKRVSKRRIVLGYEGPFLDLARAFFCKLDKFTDSEVVATVINVLKQKAKNSTSHSKTGNRRPI
jgi:hypothetical protein